MTVLLVSAPLSQSSLTLRLVNLLEATLRRHLRVHSFRIVRLIICSQPRGKVAVDNL